jgi:hypothetical protein
MATVYIGPRPKGRPEGSKIDDYVVEEHADHVLATFKTQHEAIAWAKQNGHAPHVARVRLLNDRSKADHWRTLHSRASYVERRRFKQPITASDYCVAGAVGTRYRGTYHH